MISMLLSNWLPVILSLMVQKSVFMVIPEEDKCLTIHCYQPEPGYCACVLQATDP